ncbi:MAG: Uma2 family endonuclease [Acidobacteria bacterium]|nr:Uma2 family endonuclease [Acidobacteriota bacterium]
MSTRVADYREALEHIPAGATLVFRDVGWDEYERLLEDLWDRPGLRVTYDDGRLEIMSPLPEHEKYIRFIDDLVRAWADSRQLPVEKVGSATWKRRRVAKGTEPDACYYVTNAARIIGKRRIDLEVDPPPDIVVEIDVTNESVSKFSIYAALGVPEIWRYDGKMVHFYERSGDAYRGITESRFLAGLTPAMLAEALEQSKTEGQTAALAAFRQRIQDGK